MKNTKKATTARRIAVNVKKWLLGLFVMALCVGGITYGFVREIREAFQAEVLKEEVYNLETSDFGMATMADFGSASNNFVRKQYRRNGDITMYEVRNNDVRCWVEFYSGIRIEVTRLGWIL